MDLEIIKEYGLSVFILIGAAKGIQVLYTNMRNDKKESDENWGKVFEKHEQNCKENQKAITDAMKDQSEAIKENTNAMKDVKLTTMDTNAKISLLEGFLKDVIKKEAS